ncbi:MAG: outer membrane beta-barrel protein [Pseudomonadota bacterium]
MFRVLVTVLLQALVASTYAHACENSKFTGFYAGGTVGFGKGELSDSVFETSGAVAGGYAGYNFQCGGAIFGIEGDLLWSGMNDESSQTIGGTDFTGEFSTKYLGSVRGRLGYDAGLAMLYGTIGIAFTDMETEITEVGVGSLSFPDKDTGLVLGGGVEGMVSDSMSLRFEVLHYRFDYEFDGEDYAYNPTTFRVGGAIHFK